LIYFIFISFYFSATFNALFLHELLNIKWQLQLRIKYEY